MPASILKYRGVIEGFYGPMWAHEDRLHLLQHLRGWNMNLYVYSPRDDPYHRFHWDAPYPPAEARRFAELAAEARRQGVQFSYAISPGNTGAARPDALLAKLAPFIELGCTFFPIFFDDLVEAFDPQSEAGVRHAERQATLMNGLAAAIAARCPQASFLFCPTQYATAEKSAYLCRLHALLDPRIETVVTGVDPDCGGICPRTFSDAGARRYFEHFGRRPFLWDNFTVHDLAVNVLHWTPYTGRGQHLDQLCSGLILNPLNVYLLNLPIFGCLGDYLADPRRYDPAASFRRYVTELMGEAGAPFGLELSRWFTAEWSDYRSSEENLPPLAPDAALDTAVRDQLRATFMPLRDFGERFNRTRMAPEVAARLLPFAKLLQEYAVMMLAACDGAAGVAGGDPAVALAALERHFYRLPPSLIDYAKRLLRALPSKA